MGTKAKLTFSDLIQQAGHEPIWVMNTTKGDKRGNVFFGVPNAMGTKEDDVFVVATWVPVCLTEAVTRKQLLESTALRRAVSTGMLTLISDDEAQKILAQDGAEEEANRVKQLTIGSASAEAQYGLGKESEMTESKEVEGVSNPVLQFVGLMDSNSDSESLNTLRTMGELTRKEFLHVLNKAKSLKYPQTGQYASQQAKALRPQVEEDDEA